MATPVMPQSNPQSDNSSGNPEPVGTPQGGNVQPIPDDPNLSPASQPAQTSDYKIEDNPQQPNDAPKVVDLDKVSDVTTPDVPVQEPVPQAPVQTATPTDSNIVANPQADPNVALGQNTSTDNNVSTDTFQGVGEQQSGSQIVAHKQTQGMPNNPDLNSTSMASQNPEPAPQAMDPIATTVPDVSEQTVAGSLGSQVASTNNAVKQSQQVHEMPSADKLDGLVNDSELPGQQTQPKQQNPQTPNQSVGKQEMVQNKKSPGMIVKLVLMFLLIAILAMSGLLAYLLFLS